MASPVRVREITNDEGNRGRRPVQRTAGPRVTWRRAYLTVATASPDFSGAELATAASYQSSWARQLVTGGELLMLILRGICGLPEGQTET